MLSCGFEDYDSGIFCYPYSAIQALSFLGRNCWEIFELIFFGSYFVTSGITYQTRKIKAYYS